MPVVGGIPGLQVGGDLEKIRQGTRKQWESDWVSIADTGNHAYTHDLGEIPWIVDVIYSETSDGKHALDGNSDVTIAKTETTITVTSAIGDGNAYYFKVRAM